MTHGDEAAYAPRRPGLHRPTAHGARTSSAGLRDPRNAAEPMPTPMRAPANNARRAPGTSQTHSRRGAPGTLLAPNEPRRRIVRRGPTSSAETTTSGPRRQDDAGPGRAPALAPEPCPPRTGDRVDQRTQEGEPMNAPLPCWWSRVVRGWASCCGHDVLPLSADDPGGVVTRGSRALVTADKGNGPLRVRSNAYVGAGPVVHRLALHPGARGGRRDGYRGHRRLHRYRASVRQSTGLRP